jgi:hypothetical protein
MRKERVFVSISSISSSRNTYPCKFGPTLCASPAPRVWHCAQRVLKRPAPLPESPAADALSQHSAPNIGRRAALRVAHVPGAKDIAAGVIEIRRGERKRGTAAVVVDGDRGKVASAGASLGP